MHFQLIVFIGCLINISFLWRAKTAKATPVQSSGHREVRVADSDIVRVLVRVQVAVTVLEGVGVLLGVEDPVLVAVVVDVPVMVAVRVGVRVRINAPPASIN